MSRSYWPFPAAAARRAALWRYRLPATLAFIALLAQGCAQTPPVAGADAADAGARVPLTAYRPVLGSYVSQRPVGPSPWIERNRQITPPAEKGGQ